MLITFLRKNNQYGHYSLRGLIFDSSIICGHYRMLLSYHPFASDLRGWELLEEVGSGRSGAVYKTRRLISSPSNTIDANVSLWDDTTRFDLNDNDEANDDDDTILRQALYDRYRHHQAPGKIKAAHEKNRRCNNISTVNVTESTSLHVIKIVPFYRSQRSKKPILNVMKRFAIEQKMCAWSGMIGLGPQLVSTWTTSRWGFIVMEQWDMTLAEWKKSHRIHSSFHLGNNSSVDVLSLPSSVLHEMDMDSTTMAHVGDMMSHTGSTLLDFVDYSVSTVDTRRQSPEHTVTTTAPADFEISTRQLKAQVSSALLFCTSNAPTKAVQAIVSLAKWAGHRDLKDSNIVVKLDRKNPNHLAQVGIIDWDKVSIRPRLLKQIMDII